MKFVIQLIKFAVVLGLFACGIVFANHNQSLHMFWLFGQDHELPAWKPVLGSFVAGGLFSCCFFAIQHFRLSMEVWRLRRRVRQYDSEESAPAPVEESLPQKDSHQPQTVESQ